MSAEWHNCCCARSNLDQASVAVAVAGRLEGQQRALEAEGVVLYRVVAVMLHIVQAWAVAVE